VARGRRLGIAWRYAYLVNNIMCLWFLAGVDNGMMLVVGVLLHLPQLEQMLGWDK